MSTDRDSRQSYTQADIDMLKNKLLDQPQLPKNREIYPTILALAIHWELHRKAMPIFHIPGV